MAFNYSLLGGGKGPEGSASPIGIAILVLFLGLLTTLSFNILQPTWLPISVGWITQNNNKDMFNVGNLVYTKTVQSPTSDVALDVNGNIVFQGGNDSNTWNVVDQNGRSQFSVGNTAVNSGSAAQVRTANNIVDDGLTGAATFSGVINGPVNGTLLINGQDGTVGGPVIVQTNGTLAMIAKGGTLNSAYSVLDDGTGRMTITNGLSVNSNYGQSNMNIKSNSIPVINSFWNTWISGGVGGGAVYSPSTTNWTVYSSGTGESASFGGIEMGTGGVDLYAMTQSTPVFNHPQYTTAQFKKTRVFHAGPTGNAGAAGGNVYSCDANGNVRNRLDDGLGNMVVAGNLTSNALAASSLVYDATTGVTVAGNQTANYTLITKQYTVLRSGVANQALVLPPVATFTGAIATPYTITSAVGSNIPTLIYPPVGHQINVAATAAGTNLYAVNDPYTLFPGQTVTLTQITSTRWSVTAGAPLATATGGKVFTANGNVLDTGSSAKAAFASDVQIGGFTVQTSFATGIAAAGTTCATGTVLTKALNVVATNPGGTGAVVLPTVTTIGTQVKVFNSGTGGSLQVFPSGCTGTISGSASQNIGAFQSLTFHYLAANTWYT